MQAAAGSNGRQLQSVVSRQNAIFRKYHLQKLWSIVAMNRITPMIIIQAARSLLSMDSAVKQHYAQ
jgi:hypothetical protein